MFRLELTDEEHAALTHYLEECLAELRAEISDTARHGFKERLRQQKELVVHILEKLRTPPLEKAA